MGSITVVGNQGWFTTFAGATGGKGSLVRIDLTPPYNLTNVYSFPYTNYIPPNYFGQGPKATPVQIGQDLWFVTSQGGLGTTYGTIVKYSLADNTLTNVFFLDQTNYGRQSFNTSLVKAGDSYYYLAFAGGTNTGFGTPNGAGVVGKLSFDNLNQPSVSAASLPGRFISFPSSDPVFDGTNFLYFTTAGVSTNPGAIVRYNLTNGVFTSLFNFVSNAVAVTNYGKQPYGTPVLFSNELYFTTLAGGVIGKGVVAKLTLSNNSYTKLADLNGTGLGASPQYGGGTIYTNPVNGRIAIFFPINLGGINNTGGNGTILRISFPPPILANLHKNIAGDVTLGWSGGYSPFAVDWRGSAAGGIWASNWISDLYTNTIAIPNTNSESYYRVQGVVY